MVVSVYCVYMAVNKGDTMPYSKCYMLFNLVLKHKKRTAKANKRERSPTLSTCLRTTKTIFYVLLKLTK